MRFRGTMKAVLTAAALFTAHQACAQTQVQVLPGPSTLIRGGAQVTPAGDPGRWISDADYPAAAKAARLSGTVGFVLVVDPDGTVSDCTVTSSSGSKLLDSTTCALMTRRARFVAARNSDNEPASARWASAISWTLPEAAESPKT
ncbi:MAG: TonB family protein [Pseudomonadota bacterium]